MSTRRMLVLLVSAPILLTGCGASQVTDAASAARAGAVSGSSTSNAAPDGSMAGMHMAPSASTTSSAPVQDGPPSPTATMVCGAEIQGKVRQVLKLTAVPVTRSTWVHRLYTCTYSLPMGPLVLSVKESPDKTSAAGYFDGLRQRLSPTEPLAGLGERSFATPTGTAVVVKDTMTLAVDATGLPAVFGPEQQKRTDLAYEIASDVLGCWTGND